MVLEWYKIIFEEGNEDIGDSMIFSLGDWEKSNIISRNEKV